MLICSCGSPKFTHTLSGATAGCSNTEGCVYVAGAARQLLGESSVAAGVWVSLWLCLCTVWFLVCASGLLTCWAGPHGLGLLVLADSTGLSHLWDLSVLGWVSHSTFLQKQWKRKHILLAFQNLQLCHVFHLTLKTQHHLSKQLGLERLENKQCRVSPSPSFRALSWCFGVAVTFVKQQQKLIYAAGKFQI